MTFRKPTICVSGDACDHCHLCSLSEMKKRRNRRLVLGKGGWVMSTPDQWPFQESQLEVPSIYVWPMIQGYGSGDMPAKHGQTCGTVPPFWDPEIPIDRMNQPERAVFHCRVPFPIDIWGKAPQFSTTTL